MVNQKMVEYNERNQRIEKSLKTFVIEERKKRSHVEEDPLEGIFEESWYISNSQTETLLSQYCLPTPKSLNGQMIIENYDHHLIDSDSMLNVKYEDMKDLKGRLDSVIRSFGELSFEKDILDGGLAQNSTLFDGVNFEISNHLNNYKSNFQNKRLNKFLSCDKNQKTIFDFLKPTQKRKPEEPKLSEEHQANLKKQKLISEYTCHQNGEEMFAILDRSIERKKQHQLTREYEFRNKTVTENLVPIQKQSDEQASFNNQQSSIVPPFSKSSTPYAAESKPRTYMERIKEQAKQFHSKHSKCTLTIKKKDKPSSRDILKEEDDFTIPKLDASVVNNLFSY